MTHIITRKDIDVLQMRIEACPVREQARLQAQLEAIVRSIKFEPVRDNPNERASADIEPLFDNLPV